MFADQALMRFLPMIDGQVLDIGSGSGCHAEVMRAAGKQVTTLSLREPADVIVDYLDYIAVAPFSAIWASHVLEHQPNPGLFLRKCFNDLSENGVFAVTVPPAKHNIVGGHVTLWNAGLLLYQMILAGFDCASARVGTYDYNISVIVQKKPCILPPLDMDCGDIERLAAFFPCAVEHGFDGELVNINW